MRVREVVGVSLSISVVAVLIWINVLVSLRPFSDYNMQSLPGKECLSEVAVNFSLPTHILCRSKHGSFSLLLLLSTITWRKEQFVAMTDQKIQIITWLHRLV